MTNKPSLIPQTGSLLEEKYAIALAERKSGIEGNVLLEKNIETPRDAAILLDKIVRFFYQENSDYLTEDTDHKQTLLITVSELYTFLSRGGLAHIHQMYRNFSRSGDIKDDSIYEKSKELLETISKNNLAKFLEILFSPFATLAGYREETVHGAKATREYSAYAKLLSYGKLYPEHRVEGIIRPSIGVPALTFLLEDEPSIEDLRLSIPGVVDTIVSGQLVEVDRPKAPVIQLVRADRVSLNANTKVDHIISTPGAPQVGSVLELVPGVEALKEKGPSKAQLGFLGRRERAGHEKIERIKAKNADRMQQGYQAELERLQSLSLYIDGQLRALRDTLLERIPYIREALMLIDIEEEEVGLISEQSTLRDASNREDISETITQREKEISKLQNEVEGKESELQLKKSELESREMAGQPRDRTRGTISRLSSQIGKIRIRIGRIEVEIGKLKSKLHLRNQSQKDIESARQKRLTEIEGSLQEIGKRKGQIRLQVIPNRDEFIGGLYFSLGAWGLYAEPSIIDTTAVTRDWVERRVVPLFAQIIGTYFSQRITAESDRMIDLPAILDLADQIDAIPTSYSEDVDFDTLPRFSQAQIGHFFSELIPVIPELYLLRFPSLQKKGVEKKQSVPQVRKTKSELRKVKKDARAEKENKRKSLLEELQSIAQTLELYLQFRIEEKKSIEKRLKFLRYNDQGLPRSGRNNLSQGELESKISNAETELGIVIGAINEGGLIDDEEGYQKLVRKRARISNQLRILR